MSTYLNDTQLPWKYTNAAIIPINTVIYDFDTQEIESPGLALHVSSLGTTGVLTPQWSSDEVNWVDGWCEPTVANSVASTSISAVGLYNVPKLARFMRLRVSTATTAGTTTVSVTKSYADFRTATASGNSATVGAVAHDSAVSQNPVRVAGRAISANYTAVANNDVADITTTLVGAQIVKPFSIPEADWQYAAAAGGIVNTTDVVLRAAGAAGIRNYVTGLQVRNVSAVSTEVVIKDGATVIWRDFFAANNATPREVHFATPIKGTAATALNVAATVTAAAVFVNAQGYQAP